MDRKKKMFSLMVFKSSRTIAPEENCPPTLILTLTLNQTLTLTGEGAIFLGGNCPDTVFKVFFKNKWKRRKLKFSRLLHDIGRNSFLKRKKWHVFIQ